MKRWRIGYGAFWLIIVFSPFVVIATIDALLGKGAPFGEHTRIQDLLIFGLAGAIGVAVEKFRPRFSPFLHYLNNCPLPKVTLSRIVVSTAVVGCFCFGFLWLFNNVDVFGDPRWLLPICGLIASANLLETHWVATDLRQDSELHPSSLA